MGRVRANQNGLWVSPLVRPLEGVQEASAKIGLCLWKTVRLVGQVRHQRSYIPGKIRSGGCVGPVKIVIGPGEMPGQIAKKCLIKL